MSKFSYDDLPFDVADQLVTLDFELREGDITKKGFDKKRAQILAPYQDLIEKIPQLHHLRSIEQTEDTTEVDLGPEPSAADVTDFLDFLPSPTHSPVDNLNKGASFMEENHKNLTENKLPIKPQTSPSTNNIIHQSPLLSSVSPSISHVRPNIYPPQHFPLPPRPQIPNNNNFRPNNFNTRPPFDHRMGPPRPPIYGNGFQGRPMMNGYRPPVPHHQPLLASSSQLAPMFRPPQPIYPYRPSSINNLPPPPPPPLPPTSTASIVTPNIPSTPIQGPASFKQQHSRTPSLDSKADSFYNLNFNQSRSNFDIADTDSVSDWDKSSISWRPPNRLNPSYSVHSIDTSVQRSHSNSSIGRSRYKDSYMASTFKAVESAPQPRFISSNPTDQAFLSDLAGRQMTPLEARPIPFPLYDTSNSVLLTDFNTLADLLRFRATRDDRLKDAFMLVDTRGKEPITLSWDKLNARAEKIAQSLHQKRANLKVGDRVALIYRKSEVMEFIPALMGCFLAGMTAVPINAAEDVSELSFILTLANINLILTTDHNHRAFLKDIQTKEFPPNISWWKTNEMGTWYPSKKSDYPPIKVPELAYIEYAKANNGELKGVTVSHRSVMDQCAAFYAATTETELNGSELKPLEVARKPDTVVSYFEPRQQIGLILTVLYSIYSGNTTIFTSGTIIDTPAIWIYVISKYKATIALADYPALKKITQYYQHNVKEVNQHSRKVTPDLSSLRYLIVDTTTVKSEVHHLVADKLLRPLGNTDRPLDVICPVLSLPEFGGQIVSMRDNLGLAREATHGRSQDLFSCVFDADALKNNKVVVLSTDTVLYDPNTVASFGFCMPNTKLVIVDPETATLCPADTIGEIWIHSTASVEGGFWALPKHTESIFHARPVLVHPDTMHPEVLNIPFLRTGLSGTVIGGRVFVLGTYEERIRQQRLGYDLGVEDIYYSSQLLDTIQKSVFIETCAIFEILVKNQHLPVVICESSKTRTELGRIASEIEDALYEYHGLRTYAIVFVKENGLPRQIVHGRKTIHPLMTKRCFLAGQLRARFIKMDVDRTLFHLAEHPDPVVKDIWTSPVVYDRAIRSGAIPTPLHPPQRQHTGMEKVTSVYDDRTEHDMSHFTSIVEVLQWRASRQPEEDAALLLTYGSGSSLTTKHYSWKKVSYKSAGIAAYLAKRGLQRNAKVLVTMSVGIDYLLTIYACLALGLVPVPFEPVEPQFQPQRVTEFAEQLTEVLKELGIVAILTNGQGEEGLKHNAVKAAIKQQGLYRLPEIIQVGKAPKNHKLLGKESGFVTRPDASLITVQYGPDGRRHYSHLNQTALLNQCRTQKTTCQLRSQRPLVTTGLGSYHGLGLLYALFCGPYVGSKTIMIPTSDFFTHPACLFETLQRFKTKDAPLTTPLVQFAMNRISEARFQLSLQNLMVPAHTRPKPYLYQHMAAFFQKHRVERETINTVYSHVANPMVTTRSYMLMEPVALSVEPYWLRQGIVAVEEGYGGLVLHDSGIVPSNTMIAIVNPETRTVCPNHTWGEIWVSSDSNMKVLTDEEGEVCLHDPTITYRRTGDYGFLWHVRRRVDNRPVLEEGQCLYVLGSANETIVKNGLVYFPMDVEFSIERSHPSIPSGGSVIFQTKDEIVVVASVKNNEDAVSVIPLIVNTILDHHGFLVDAIAIVTISNLPKSRYGEKIRKKVMNLYIEKKLQVVYLKRLTQYKGTPYSQSQLSLSDSHSIQDNASVRLLSENDFQIPQTLARQDSRVSQSNVSIPPHTPI